MDTHNGPDQPAVQQTGRDHLLHRLFDIQQQLNHVPQQAMLELAVETGLPISQINAVVDFYSFFHREPRGRYDLLFSNCTSCGDTAMMQSLCERLNVTPGKTRADGVVSIAETSCIGMCDQGPALLVGGRTVTALTEQRLEQIARQIESATPVEQWPAEWFRIHDNVRKNGLLLGTPFETGSALRTALDKGQDAMLQEIVDSGLRGRGGAGFSTGMKWKFCREASGEAHYVVCNADEGEPGTFKDRILLNSHAHMVFEGMSICGYIIGSAKGYLYLRGEYRYLLKDLQAVLKRRRKAGLLGDNILDSGFDFDIDIVVGAGAYICGEESALIESLEEKRGIPRVRPPFPVTRGLFGQPTVVNNVETLAAAAHIAVHGSAWFAGHGTDKSAGSKVLSVSGDCDTPGVYEYPFGISIQRILDDCGAEDVQAVQIGGPAGTLIGPDEFERKLGFEDLATGGSMMIYGRERDLLRVIHNFAHFFAHESCGFCTPCRVGTTLLKNGLDKIASGHGTRADVDEMYRLATLVKRRSHCGLGQTAPNPLLDMLERFPDILEARLAHKAFEPHFDLDGALDEARKITHRDDAEAHLS